MTPASTMESSGFVRYALAAIGALFLVIGVAFVFQVDWAKALWPWPDGRLTYIFVGSIAAAVGAPVLWIGLSGEIRAAEAGAANVTVIAGGITLYLLTLAGGPNGRGLLPYAVGTAFVAVLTFVIWLLARQQPLHDQRPVPSPVRASFVVFACILFVVGILLLLGMPNLIPWPLKPETSGLIGWIFLGAGIYFTYGVLRPASHLALGQLLGFLAYDIVLLPALLAHTADVRPEHVFGLAVYIVVLIFSALLAIYYLLIDPSTRLISTRRVAA